MQDFAGMSPSEKNDWEHVYVLQFFDSVQCALPACSSKQLQCVLSMLGCIVSAAASIVRFAGAVAGCDGDCPDGVSAHATVRLNTTMEARLLMCVCSFCSRNIYLVCVRFGLAVCLIGPLPCQALRNKFVLTEDRYARR